MSCMHARYRTGKTCESFAAPSLWCNACWPTLAAERGINHRLWPEREAVWPEAVASTAENDRFDAPGCQMCGASPDDPCGCHDPQSEENER
jgi:hypothetical protein